MALAAEISLSTSVLLLVLGAIGLYIASRAAADAMARHHHANRPGRLALGHWMPIAAVAWMAAAAGQADIALGVIFASSVAVLTLAAGLVTYVNPPGALPPSRRAWPFLLAAALLPLFAGFSGHLAFAHALMMAVLGLAVLSVWNGAAQQESTVAEVLSDLHEEDEDAAPAPQAEPVLQALQWVLAVGLAALGAKLAVSGTVSAEASSRSLHGGVLTPAVLGPLLILPMLATGTDLAQRSRSAEAHGTFIGVALLNLCALLPSVIVVWYIRTAFAARGADAAGLTLLARLHNLAQPIPMPVGIWRIDTVVLTVLGFALIPISLGRWVITRIEAAALILGYAAYLAAIAATTVRG